MADRRDSAEGCKVQVGPRGLGGLPPPPSETVCRHRHAASSGQALLEMMSHCARGGIANNSTTWLDSPRDEVIDRVPVLDVGSVVTMIRFIDDERSAVAKFKLLGHLRKPCRAGGIILRTLVIQDAAQRPVRRDHVPAYPNAFAVTW